MRSKAIYLALVTALTVSFAHSNEATPESKPAPAPNAASQPAPAAKAPDSVPMQARVFSPKERAAAMRLEALARETTLLNAENKRAEIRKKFEETRKSTPSTQSSGSLDQIRVTAIESFNGKRIASISLADGQVFERSAGEKLPGGITVEAISSDSVLFSQGKKKLNIGTISSSAATNYTSTQTGSMSTLPPPVSIPGR